MSRGVFVKAAVGIGNSSHKTLLLSVNVIVLFKLKTADILHVISVFLKKELNDVTLYAVYVTLKLAWPIVKMT